MPTTGIDVSPNVVQGSPLDSRELVLEYYFAESGRFRTNTAIKRNWPNPGFQLVANSNAADPVDVDGRYTHTVQVTGIAVSSGDTLVIQASLDGVNYYNLPVTPSTLTPTAVTTIAANGIYNLTSGNYWKMQAVVTPGGTTGTTVVTLISKT